MAVRAHGARSVAAGDGRGRLRRRRRRGWCGDNGGDTGRSRHGRPGQRRRPLQRQVVQPVGARRPEPGEGRARRRDAGDRVPRGRRLRAEPVVARAAGLRRDDRRRLPARGGRQHGRAAVPGRELRDHRLLGDGAAVHRREEERRDPGQRPRPDVRDEREQLSDRLHGRDDGQGAGRRAGDLGGRRPGHPDGEHLHRRLPGRREGLQPGHQGPHRVLAGLRSRRTSARSSR